MKILLITALIVAPILKACADDLASPAPSATPQQSAALQQTASGQEQLRADTQSLVTRLNDLIDDYKRNGLDSGDDYTALVTVRDALGSLDANQMQQVADLLRTAFGDRILMSRAFAGQKEISVQLKQILAAHSVQQDLDAICNSVRQLAGRQAANLNAGIDSGQLAAVDHTDAGQAAVTASEQAEQSEQAAIAAEVKIVADKLAAITSGSAHQDSIDELNRVAPEASSAADALGGGKLDDAMPLERVAHDQLDEVARNLTPAGTQQPAPTGEPADLADLAHQQHALIAQTGKLSAESAKLTAALSQDASDKAMIAQIQAPQSPLAIALADANLTISSSLEQIRALPDVKEFLDNRAADLKEQQQALQPQLATVASAESALAAKTQIARDAVQQSAPQSAAPLTSALPPMAAAQQALAAGDLSKALRSETEAVSELDAARRSAMQSANGHAASPNPAQQLRQLQAAVNGLAGRENASLQQGDALKTGQQSVPATELQQSMADKAASLEQTARAIQSPAADALHQAADALRDAAQSMASGADPAKTTAAQQAAQKALADAADQLKQGVADLAHDSQRLANMQRAMGSLNRLLQQQRQLAIEPSAGGADRARQFAPAQAGLQRNAASRQKALAADSPDAADALGHAASAMDDAAKQLTDDDPDGAGSHQREALGLLAKAQDSLADQMQKTAEGLGQSFANQRNQADAALVRAQSAAGSAAKALSTGGDGKASLQQAATDLNSASSQPQALPQAARDALRQAAQDLAQATASAAAGQGSQAADQATQASQAMQAAQSAIDQQASGVADHASGVANNPAGTAQQPSSKQGPSQASENSQTPQNPGQAPGPGSSTSATQGANGANEKAFNDQAGTPTASSTQTSGAGQYQGLPDRDRAALQQSQSETYPREYSTQVEQYMRNLATGTNAQ